MDGQVCMQDCTTAWVPSVDAPSTMTTSTCGVTCAINPARVSPIQSARLNVEMQMDNSGAPVDARAMDSVMGRDFRLEYPVR